MIRFDRFLPLAALLLAVAACNNNTVSTPAADPLPTGLKLSAAPAEAPQPVGALRGSAKDGQRIVVTGKIAGRKDPIGENRAILTLLDTGIKTCDQEEGDACKTPWDACCEPSENLAKHSVAVQVADASGNPLKASLTGVEGVKPLATVIVSGTSRVSADGNVTVDADGIYIVK
jgi:hypothetical protein